MTQTNGRAVAPAPVTDPRLSDSPGAESSATSVAALEVRGLWAGYNSHPALEDVTFDVAPGEIVNETSTKAARVAPSWA